jgi:NTP pyrophosphatase (non-canonical NTP hydrolase)
MRYFWDLQAFQVDHRLWLAHNFPDQTPHQALLGLAEEVGELAHAHLKHEQTIRGYDYQRYQEEAMDAIGDIIIYLASYCNSNGLDLAKAAQDAWEEVRERDWIKYPETGKAPTDAEQSKATEDGQGVQRPVKGDSG